MTKSDWTRKVISENPDIGWKEFVALTKKKKTSVPNSVFYTIRSKIKNGTTPNSMGARSKGKAFDDVLEKCSEDVTYEEYLEKAVGTSMEGITKSRFSANLSYRNGKPKTTRKVGRFPEFKKLMDYNPEWDQKTIHGFLEELNRSLQIKGPKEYLTTIYLGPNGESPVIVKAIT